MSERWPRFGFKQPATDPEAGTVASTDGADPDADVKAPAVAAMEPAPTHAETPGETTEQALVAEAAASTGAPGPDEATAQAQAPETPAGETAQEDSSTGAGAAEAKADEGSEFLDELVRVMQATARGERARIGDDTDRRLHEHVEKVRARQASEADRMRELAGDDMKSIAAWAEGETTRIQVERERRERDLNQDLEGSLAGHSSKVDREIEAIEAAIATYRAEVDAFFEALDRETDPVLIAQRASRRPVFPELDAVGASPTPAESGMVGVMDPDQPARLGSWASPDVTIPAPPSESVATTNEPASSDMAEPVGASGPSPRSDTALLETVPAERPMSWLRRARTVGEDDSSREG